MNRSGLAGPGMPAPSTVNPLGGRRAADGSRGRVARHTSRSAELAGRGAKGGTVPIYMDRHDIRDASAEAVARAHQRDLKVQQKYHCRSLTYWFDEDRGTAFCLIEAPAVDAVREMHREAHGLIPNEIIEVDPSAVASFLGRVADPPHGSVVRESAFRALVFTDMVDSTKLTNELGDDAAFDMVQHYHDIVSRQVKDCGGTEVDRAGDGFLLSFQSASKAVKCAIGIQQELGVYNRDHTPSIRVRIGIGAGEPVTKGSSLFGSIVNLTARVCDRASPEGIYVASVVRDLCKGKSYVFEDLGSLTFKGFDEPVRLFEVKW